MKTRKTTAASACKLWRIVQSFPLARMNSASTVWWYGQVRLTFCQESSHSHPEIRYTAQSRRCPLCTQTIGDYVIHDIRSRFDYRKHHLAPLRSSSPQLLLPPQTSAAVEARNTARRRRRDRERERRQREELGERDKLELSIATRRWIYKHDLYAKVRAPMLVIPQRFDPRGCQV